MFNKFKLPITTFLLFYNFYCNLFVIPPGSTYPSSMLVDPEGEMFIGDVTKGVHNGLDDVSTLLHDTVDSHAPTHCQHGHYATPGHVVVAEKQV